MTFDWSEYGRLIARYRENHDMSVMCAVETIGEETGYHMARSTLCSYEAGKPPRSEAFLAINRTYFGDVFPSALRELIKER